MEQSAAMRPEEPPRLYFPAIDGLRGAAVLSVLLYHTSWFSNGLFGVDVFMVISGFLITLLLFREVGRTGRVAVLAFYRRRFKRLMPGLAMVLLATLVLAYLLDGVEDARHTGSQAIAALFQYANWQQIGNEDAYWEGFGRISPLAHMWSLSIIEQFYMVWPVVCLGLFRICRRSALAVTVVTVLLLAGTATIAPLWYDGTNSDRLYLGTETRTVDFVAGSAAAGVVFLRRRRAARVRHSRASGAPTVVATCLAAFSLSALVTVSVLTSSYHEPWLYQGGMAAVAIITAILIASLCHDRGPLVRLFSFGPLAEMGRISYPMYLLHLPIFWVMQELRPTITPYAVFVVGGGLTWLASMLMHYAVTERIRVRTWRPLRAVPIALLATGAIIAGGYFLPTAVEYRVNPEGRPAVLLLGDSLSRDFAEALAADPNGRYFGVDGSIPGCGIMEPDAVRPLSGEVWPVSDRCQGRERHWRDALRRTSYQAILTHFERDVLAQKVGGRWLTPCDPEYRAGYLPRLEHAVRQIQEEAPGVPVLLMNARSGMWGATGTSVTCYNKIIEEFTNSGWARLLDIDAMLCPRDGCLETDPAGRKLFVDGVHFTAAGREFVGPMLQRTLAESLSATG